MPDPNKRCPWAINYGVTLHTRCAREVGHLGTHRGPGLADHTGQHIEWFRDDRREYLTRRQDAYSWESTGRDN